MIFFGGNKRPKGNESLNEFIQRRMREIQRDEERKMKGTLVKVRQKGFIETELIKQGYWPEDDSHHDVVRATLITKCMTVGIYAASILMVLYIYSMLVTFRYEPIKNPSYHVHFMFGETLHYFIAQYIFIFPLLICMFYKMFWIHIPRMNELSWYKMVPEKEQTELTKKINFYMDYYMLFAAIVLCSYGKLLTIYLTTYGLWELVYVHNDDCEPLFYQWEIYLLKAVGLWLELDVTFDAKYHCCLKFVINEQLRVPEPVKDPFNQRTGIALNPWLYMKTRSNQYAEDIFFAGCTPENPGKIPELFKILRTEGPEVAKEHFKEMYKEEIEGYNQGMKDIQKELCKAYGEHKPLPLGRFPYSKYALYQPYPKQWLKEMAEGKR